MKWSPILHSIAAIAGVLGLLVALGGFVAEINGDFLGYSREHIFADAAILLLISIAFGIGALIHRSQEKTDF